MSLGYDIIQVNSRRDLVCMPAVSTHSCNESHSVNRQQAAGLITQERLRATVATVDVCQLVKICVCKLGVSRAQGP